MPEPASDVEEFVRRWLDAKRSGDGDAIGAGLSDYEGVLAIGTGEDEWIAGPAAFAEAHTGAGPFPAILEHVEAHREGDTAWAAVRSRVEWDEGGALSVRLTLMLVADAAGGWRIVQSHASVGG